METPKCGVRCSHAGTHMTCNSERESVAVSGEGMSVVENRCKECGSSGSVAMRDDAIAFALSVLRGCKGGSRADPLGCSEGYRNDDITSPVLSPAEHVQAKRVNGLANKRWRRDLVGSPQITAAALLPGTCSPTTTSGSDDQSSSGGAIAPSTSYDKGAAAAAANPSGAGQSRFASNAAPTECMSLRGMFLAGKFDAGNCTGVALVQSVEGGNEEVRASLEISGGTGGTANGSSCALEMVVSSPPGGKGGAVVSSDMSGRGLSTALASDHLLPVHKESEGGCRLQPCFLFPGRDVKTCCRLCDAGPKAASGEEEDGCVLYTESSDSRGDSQLDYVDDAEEHATLLNKLKLLKSQTLQQMAKHWGTEGEGDDKETCCAVIAERIGSLIVSICMAASDRGSQRGPASSSLEVQGGSQRRGRCTTNKVGSPESYREGSVACGSVNDGNSVGTSSGVHDEERSEKFICHGKHIRMWDNKTLEYLSHALGIKDSGYQGDITRVAAYAVAVLIYFAPLPLPLLEDICRELLIPTDSAEKETVDVHVRAESLAEKISNHLYPMCCALHPIAKYPLVPQMQVHEHAPGRYTCTVDNAKLLKDIPLHRSISNQFSCNKIRWQAVLMLRNDRLTFHVWHRHTDPLVARMVLRAQDPKRKRKGNKNNGTSNTGEGNGEDLPAQTPLKERQVLFLEKEAEAAQGQLIGFDDFVQLSIAFQGHADGQRDYRLYNSSEDRLMFQFALDLFNPDGTPLAESKVKNTTKNSKSRKSTSDSKQVSTPGTVGNVVAEEKRRKEVEKLVQKLEKQEDQEREVIKKTWTSAHRHLIDEHNRAWQKVLQEKRDRERRILLAKVGPSPELERELNTLKQTVAAHSAQVARLSKEKVKEKESLLQLQTQIEEGNREIEELRQQLKIQCETLAEIEEKKKAVAERKKQRGEIAQQRDANIPAGLHIPGFAATRHDKLAIDDVQTFLMSAATKDLLADSFEDQSPSMNFTSQFRSAEREAATVAGLVTPVERVSSSANGEGVSLPLPRSAGMINGGCTFAQQTAGCLDADLGWETYSKPLSFTTMLGSTKCDDVLGPMMSACDVPSTSPLRRQLHSIDISQLTGEVGDDVRVTNGSSSTSNSGFTVTAVFSAPDSASRFSLDANAAPYTPTPSVSNPRSTNTLLHDGFAADGIPNDPLMRLSPQISSPPPHSGGGSVIGGGMFPEKPRYTYVSTPVTTSGASTGIGLFDIKSFGPSNGSSEPPKPRPYSGGEVLTFPTAQWTF